MSEDEMLNEDELTDRLAGLIGSNPMPEEKHNVHSFLFNVATADDTTKLGNINETELGTMPQTVRSSKELALISDKIMNNNFFKDYFDKESEIMTATSLSKDAKLVSLAVLQKREVADVTKKSKPNKGWFKPKNSDSDNE
jgi:hypothetical protein